MADNTEDRMNRLLSDGLAKRAERLGRAALLKQTQPGSRLLRLLALSRSRQGDDSDLRPLPVG